MSVVGGFTVGSSHCLVFAYQTQREAIIAMGTSSLAGSMVWPIGFDGGSASPAWAIPPHAPELPAAQSSSTNPTDAPSAPASSTIPTAAP